jgi:alanine-glyoxylate transaminase / serine-glyoxylate transaminase / serine-pyruvate transaminase
MTVANGRQFLAVPGPTNVPDAVLQAMQQPAVDIYSGPLLALTDRCLAGLGQLFGTTGRCFIYAANGHGAWEAALTNVLSRGDKVLVLESGGFALGWGETAKKLGAEIEILPGSFRTAVDPAAFAQRVKADTEKSIKAVLVVQVDTASSVVNDIPALRRALDEADHPALLMVDTIASLGTMPFHMDEWGVDVTITGSQKGLMTPPGLSFASANERAWQAHQTADMRTPYWDWTFRSGPEHYMKYCGTPPEHLLYGLGQALEMIFSEGLEAIWQRHALLAEAVRRAVGVWSEGQVLQFNIVEPRERSNSVTTVLLPDGMSPAPLYDFCQQRCGVTLGIGINKLSGKAFRIAHMGHVNAPMVLGTLAVIEVALQALGIPHGRGGLQAATDWLGSKVTPVPRGDAHDG